MHQLAGDSLRQSKMFHLLDDAVSFPVKMCLWLDCEARARA